MARKYAWLTPDSPAAEETRCRAIHIPNQPGFIQAVSGALLPLTQAENWQQFGTMTPEEAAEVMFEAYADMMQPALPEECCKPCRMPGNKRIYRVAPTTGRFEYLEEEEWVEDADIPDPAPSTETDPYDAECKAASNAANGLHTIWTATLQISDAGVGAADALIDTGAATVAALGTYFAPPILGIMTLLQTAWEIIYYTYQFLTYEMWDERFTETLTCFLLQNADWNAETGIVTFNYAQLRRDLWGASFSGQAYLLQIAQLSFMLDVIGPQGLDQLGALDNVAGECGCGEWCRQWELSELLNSSWVLVHGRQDAAGYFESTYNRFPGDEGADVNLMLELTIPAGWEGTKLTRIEVRDTRAAGGWMDMLRLFKVTPGTPAQQGSQYYYKPDTWAVAWGYNAGSESGTLPVVLNLWWRTAGGPQVTVNGIRLRGTGRNPFLSEGDLCG